MGNICAAGEDTAVVMLSLWKKEMHTAPALMTSEGWGPFTDHMTSRYYYY